MDFIFHRVEGLEPPEKIPQFKRETPKIGRNEKCQCGSGKKFKNCCMKTEEGSRL